MVTIRTTITSIKGVIHIETCFNYCSPEQGFFSSDERKWITQIHKLKAKYPDMIEIIREPEQNDGCIYAKLPPKFLKVEGPRACNQTEEQRLAVGARLTAARMQKKNG